MSEFDKIIGYDSIKYELNRICEVLKNFEKYERLGARQPTGLLLYGPTGVGKSLMANCFIKQSGWNVFVCRKDKPDEAFVNEIKNIYENAKNNQPAIVFLDDMDKFSETDLFGPTDTDEFITIQSCIDDAKDKKIFTLATANSIKFPESLIRAGRFDKSIKINKPKGDDCKKIIQYYLSQKKHIANLDIDEISKILDNSSCAELELVINDAAIYAGEQNKTEIDTDDIIKSCMRVLFEAPESLENKEEKYIERLAYHEAGHAVVREVLKPNSINLLSVCKHEGDIGGVTSCSPFDGMSYKTKATENSIVCFLGGKAATELIYGEIDLGATSDTNIAYIMTETLLINYLNCGFQYINENYDISEQKRSKIENKIADELDRYYIQAKQILAQNINFLHALAKELVKHKTLRAKDIKQIKTKLNINI